MRNDAFPNPTERRIASPELYSGPAEAPRIADYAVIGDCRTAALVSRDGSIDWLCLPHFSGSSVFAALLDCDRGGFFSIRPREPYKTTRRYIPNTAVLETVFETESGAARVIDCLPVVEGLRGFGPLREVLRVVEGIHGRVDMDLTISPRPLYATIAPRPEKRGALGWCFAWKNEVLYLRTDIALAESEGSLRGRISVTPGQRVHTSLSYAQNEPAVVPALGAGADTRLSDTIEWWSGWTAGIRYDGPFRDAVARSAITLKLMTYSPSGAIVAAPTTSLPEAIGKGRNWDYRYCWLRDAGMTMEALLGLNIHDTAGQFLDWMLHATRLTQPRLQIMYDIYGRTNLAERSLDHLSGYRDSRPVRIGNGAYRQQQLDVYGEVARAAELFVANGGKIDSVGARMLIGLGKVVCKIWQQPDSGIWEVRGKLRHHTYSKLMCWVTLDRLLKLEQHGALKLGRRRAHFKTTRDEIAAYLESQCFNEQLGAYTSEAQGTKADASLLTMPCVGYNTAHDARMKGTFDLIHERLDHGGLLQRYEGDTDGLDGTEGAFGICSFWGCDHRAQRGELAEAEALFVRLLGYGNDVGLFAEEIDPDTGEALGNFPQAFTHVGLINAAVSIEAARRQGIPQP